ncbi:MULTISPECIES: phage holin, lambda family [Proteus]|uniref:Phage holin, lambda family n=1 Tax=Proteus penneri TaxID=102862 RepID=A0ABS0VYP7_9GAMM|nr:MULTISPECIES: phage holin, lambda family [Proteus]MBJ2116171.1 phage holin, lambda family [Proteus penneri]NBN26144.1 phage holin, lambda family [Proteus sp. G2657]SUC00223.1 phage holin (lysis protein) [Proteus penneri]
MNHMKESPEFWDQVFQVIVAHKEQGISASLATGMAILRGKYNGGGWTKTLFDGAMCALFAWFVKDLLTLLSLNQDFAYLASVFIGYVGVDGLSKLIKGKAGLNND